MMEMDLKESLASTGIKVDLVRAEVFFEQLIFDLNSWRSEEKKFASQKPQHEQKDKL